MRIGLGLLDHGRLVVHRLDGASWSVMVWAVGRELGQNGSTALIHHRAP
jgi:hypothetical protein